MAPGSGGRCAHAIRSASQTNGAECCLPRLQPTISRVYKIHHRAQVRPLRSDPDISGVAHPHLARAIDRLASQQQIGGVAKQLVQVVVAPEATGHLRHNPVFPHDPSDPVAPAHNPLTPDRLVHTGVAVHLSVLLADFDNAL